MLGYFVVSAHASSPLIIPFAISDPRITSHEFAPLPISAAFARIWSRSSSLKRVPMTTLRNLGFLLHRFLTASSIPIFTSLLDFSFALFTMRFRSVVQNGA
jgi:hypothetical protein